MEGAENATVQERDQRIDSVRKVAREGDDAAIVRALEAVPPADAAEGISRMDPAERTALLERLPPETIARLIHDFPRDARAPAMLALSPAALVRILVALPSDTRADALAEMPRERSEAALAAMDKRGAGEARVLLSYPQGTAGALMATEYIRVPHGRRTGQIVAQLQGQSDRYARLPINYLYAVDDEDRLVGLVRPKDLLLSPPDTPIEQTMIRDPITAKADLRVGALVDLFERHRLLALPIVNDRGQILGIVTQDDALRAAREEGHRGLLRFLGVSGGVESREDPLPGRVRGRLSWLSINLLLNLISASVIQMFEETVRQVVALAVFMPVLSDMSGCSGNQAVGITIREITLGRTGIGRILWVLRREMSVGLINGAVLGTLLTGIAWLWHGNPWVGLVVGSALGLNNVVAVCVGGTVPLIVKRMGRDPALISGPLLTTVTDACGFFLSLSMATLLLHRLS